MVRLRPVKAVDILWDNIFDDDPSAHQTNRALDTLAQKEEEHYATPEVFTGRFYHLARAAYRGIYFLEDLSPAEMQAILAEEARNILSCIITDLDSLTQNGELAAAAESRGLMLYGQANEFTPIVIGNNSEAVVNLASREDDKWRRTDLMANYFDVGEAVPIQMKTSEDVKPSHAPDNGIVIVASDFGNEYLRVSRAVLNPADSDNRLTIKIASELFTDTVCRRNRSKEEHDQEIRELRASHKQRGMKLTSSIGEVIPELGELRKSLSLIGQAV